MKVNSFGCYVVYHVSRAAVEYRILFGFHLLVPILGIWPPSSSSQNEYQKTQNTKAINN